MFAISSSNPAILWQWDLRTVRSPVVTPTKLQVRFKITLEWSFHHTHFNRHPLFLPLWEDPASQWELLQTRTLKSGKIGLPLSLFLSPFYVCLQPASHRSSNWTLRMFYIFPSPLSCSTAKLQNSDSTRCKKSEKKKKKQNQTLSWVQSLCYHALVIPSSRHPQPACFHFAGGSFWDQTVEGCFCGEAVVPNVNFYTSEYFEDCPLGQMFGISCPGSNGHGWNLSKEIIRGTKTWEPGDLLEGLGAY